MTDDELDALLSRAMDVAPGAALPARVRDRLDRDRAAFQRWPRTLVAAALAAAAGVAWLALVAPTGPSMSPGPEPPLTAVAPLLAPELAVASPGIHEAIADRSGRVSPPPRRTSAPPLRTTPPVDVERARLVSVSEPLPVVGTAVESQRPTGVEVPRLSVEGITLAPIDIAPLAVEPLGVRFAEFQGGVQ